MKNNFVTRTLLIGFFATTFLTHPAQAEAILPNQCAKILSEQKAYAWPSKPTTLSQSELQLASSIKKQLRQEVEAGRAEYNQIFNDIYSARLDINLAMGRISNEAVRESLRKDLALVDADTAKKISQEVTWLLILDARKALPEKSDLTLSRYDAAVIITDLLAAEVIMSDSYHKTVAKFANIVLGSAEALQTASKQERWLVAEGVLLQIKNQTSHYSRYVKLHQFSPEKVALIDEALVELIALTLEDSINYTVYSQGLQVKPWTESAKNTGLTAAVIGAGSFAVGFLSMGSVGEAAELAGITCVATSSAVAILDGIYPKFMSWLKARNLKAKWQKGMPEVCSSAWRKAVQYIKVQPVEATSSQSGE